MISEEEQEQAALYTLGLLDANEIAAFESAMETNPDLRELVRDLREAAAAIALSSSAQTPPSPLKQKIMRQATSAHRTAWRQPQPSWIPWAIAAGLALACGLLVLGRETFSKTLSDLRRQNTILTSERERATRAAAENRERAEAAESQIANLSAERDALAKKITRLEEHDSASRVEAAKLTADRDALKQRIGELERNTASANIQTAILTSKMVAAPQATATIVWDAAKQEGTLKAVDVPPNPIDRDYQLWIIDAKYRDPVSAGVFSVAKERLNEIVFRPKLPVFSATSFAVSLERKGGVAKAQGPMVLVSK